jgi:hypothetical protein
VTDGLCIGVVPFIVLLDGLDEQWCDAVVLEALVARVLVRVHQVREDLLHLLGDEAILQLVTQRLFLVLVCLLLLRFVGLLLLLLTAWLRCFRRPELPLGGELAVPLEANLKSREFPESKHGSHASTNEE